MSSSSLSSLKLLAAALQLFIHADIGEHRLALELSLFQTMSLQVEFVFQKGNFLIGFEFCLCCGDARLLIQRFGLLKDARMLLLSQRFGDLGIDRFE